MARCGRCGLWSSYPDDYKEQKYAGVCLWYQIRLDPGSVYDERECSDFVERIPGLSPMEHFDYKVKRDNLGSAWDAATRAKKLSIIGLTVSLLSLIIGLTKFIVNF